MTKKTAIAYFDANNFHLGIRSTLKMWVDVHKLAEAFAPWTDVKMTRYFSAQILATTLSPRAPIGQMKYMEAMRASNPKVHMQMGRYAQHVVNAELADSPGEMVRVISRVEKGTDVNLAVAMVEDAYNHRSDWIILVSNDSDLAAAARVVRERGIKILWVPPIVTAEGEPTPKGCLALREYADEIRAIREATLQRCLLPEVIQVPGGRPIYRPDVYSRMKAAAAAAAEEELGPVMG